MYTVSVSHINCMTHVYVPVLTVSCSRAASNGCSLLGFGKPATYLLRGTDNSCNKKEEDYALWSVIQERQLDKKENNTNDAGTVYVNSLTSALRHQYSCSTRMSVMPFTAEVAYALLCYVLLNNEPNSDDWAKRNTLRNCVCLSQHIQ